MFWNTQEPRPLRLCSVDFKQNSRRQSTCFQQYQEVVWEIPGRRLSVSSQSYHRCCDSGRPWYADTRVERDGLTHRCLPYYQRWTHWASVKYLNKTWRVSLSIGVRITMIRCVVYLLRIFKVIHGLMNNPVFALHRKKRLESTWLKRQRLVLVWIRYFVSED